MIGLRVHLDPHVYLWLAVVYLCMLTLSSTFTSGKSTGT